MPTKTETTDLPSPAAYAESRRQLYQGFAEIYMANSDEENARLWNIIPQAISLLRKAHAKRREILRTPFTLPSSEDERVTLFKELTQKNSYTASAWESAVLQAATRPEGSLARNYFSDFCRLYKELANDKDRAEKVLAIAQHLHGITQLQEKFVKEKFDEVKKTKSTTTPEMYIQFFLEASKKYPYPWQIRPEELF